MSVDLWMMNFKHAVQNDHLVLKTHLPVYERTESLILVQICGFSGFTLEGKDILHAFDKADQTPEGVILIHESKKTMQN